MPAFTIPPCPENWERCDHCGAGPDEGCLQPDYEDNGRKPTMNHYIPQGDADRKAMPMARGLLDYFPAALAAVSSHSYLANQKHNPGEEINWARGKSNDHADCIMRHLIERGGVEEVELPDGQIVLLRSSAALAWRALALLQEELEAEGYAPGRASRWPDWPKEGQPEPASVLELNAG